MSGVKKSRRVCFVPNNAGFKATHGEETDFLTFEELEAIRLCDLEELPQDVACAKMEISRGTFQRILYAARKKVAYALINGHGIEISGGNYQIADSFCGNGAQCEQCKFKRGE